MSRVCPVFPNEEPMEDLLRECPTFSGGIGTDGCASYGIDLLDQVPVRLPPYRYPPPKVNILKALINDLLLVPKPRGDFRMVFDTAGLAQT
jgi:hypothetical protein